MKKNIFFVLILMVIISGYIKEELQIDSNTPSVENTNRALLTKSSSPGDVYYWAYGEKIYLNLIEDRYFTIFNAMAIEAEVTEMTNLTLDELTPYSYFNGTSNSIDESNVNYYYACVDSTTISAYSDAVIYSAPYLSNGVNDVGITNIFYVKLKSESDIGVLYAFAEEHNSTVICENFLPLWYTLSCTNQSTKNALELANIAYESGLFAASDVELYGDVQVDATYNDIYYTSQWNLFGTYGINLGATHDITMGNSSVIVSIVDNCIQLNHPDLIVTDSYDATTQTSPGRLYYDPETNDLENHGTSMTGIIGATTNNNIGIVGIAPSASILPISVDFSNASSQGLARAIRYAADNGARVISNSWSSNGAHQARDEAFEYALDKGCILVQSSGNLNSTTPRYPYCLYPDVIVTGNSNSSGNRYVNPNKPSSGSNYNEYLDIMAPGTSIRTLSSSSGYLSSTGTSPACAHISAIATLMLSVNPDLTRQEVSDILESTARKLPAYTFTTTSGRPNGTWNNELGYGLVNCYDAVNLAYHYNASNYFNLIEFDYSGSQIEIDLKTKDNIAVIWDWESKDISYINATASSPTDTTITHNYGTTGSRRIIIAETIAPGETTPTSSTALTRFELTTGNNASNIDIKSINSALEYIRIIGGANFASQTVSINSLNALKELYLVQLKNASISVKNCSSLTTFGTSSHIWRHREFSSLTPITPDALDPNVVGGGTTSPNEWPNVPETQMSPTSLSISNCPYISTLSLENAGFMNLSFSGMNYLSYVYLSSQLGKIVGAGSNSFMPTTYGYFLSSAISTLPTRDDMSKGKIVIRAVNTSNTDYIPVSIGNGHKTNIQTKCDDKKWILVWDSGIN